MCGNYSDVLCSPDSLNRVFISIVLLIHCWIIFLRSRRDNTLFSPGKAENFYTKL